MDTPYPKSLIIQSTEKYLEKQAAFPRLLNQEIRLNTGVIVVIPCYNEPNLLDTLDSLAKCTCPEAICVEVLIVINEPENANKEVSAQNLKAKEDFIVWNKLQTSSISFQLILVKLPIKHAGVGLARKVGMDEAVRRFSDIPCNENGIIVCLDADCLVDKNYLEQITDHFISHDTNGCSIYFEHPIKGEVFDEKVYSSIIQYELFLRYYKNGLKYAGLPFAFHTVGSSMAVTVNAYIKQGGMNRRKAGEDFYFIQKIIQLGRYTELNSTRVKASPRTSDRVPFGTGKAVHDLLNKSKLLTYSPDVFIELAKLVKEVPRFWNNESTQVENAETLNGFLLLNDVGPRITEIKNNVSNQNQFINRFFRWFDAFKVMKFTHYFRDEVQEPVEIFNAANELLTLMDYEEYDNIESVLKTYRAIDKNTVL